MIKLHRIKEPEYLQKAVVLKETQEAILLFDPARDNEPGIEEKRSKFKFDKYNDPEVKDALKKMCHNKCAYCESSFLHVYYGDIEHFRPKKFIGTRKEKVEPGYYWLANTWENFFLSCLFCNQAKKNKVSVDGVLKEITIGKQNQFPFLTEKLNIYKSRRDHNAWINGGDKIDNQARGILDPCLDKPEEFFKYTVEGVIIPRGRKKSKVERANNSITVYALQRLYLVQERRKKLIEISSRFQSIEDILLMRQKQEENNAPVALLNDLEEKFMNQAKDLFLYTHFNSAYSAMCRQFVYSFFKSKFKMKTKELNALEEKIHEEREGEWFKDFI